MQGLHSPEDREGVRSGDYDLHPDRSKRQTQGTRQTMQGVSGMSEPLFRSAHEALVFAFNYSGQAYDAPLMNRMAWEPQNRPTKGLAGLDGAAQAGMIKAELSRLAPVYQAALTARVLPRSERCECKSPCCSGERPNPEWSGAVNELAMFAIGALSGMVTHQKMRRGLVARYFGAEVRIIKLAERLRLNRDVVGQCNAKIVSLLKEVEGRAWHEIDQRLIAAKMIPASVAA